MPVRNGKFINWKVHIEGIRKLLTDDNSEENAKKVGKEIYNILTSQRYLKYFKDYDNETGGFLDDFLYIENCEHLNDLLEQFYDYCDYNLIWINLD